MDNLSDGLNEWKIAYDIWMLDIWCSYFEWLVVMILRRSEYNIDCTLGK